MPSPVPVPFNDNFSSPVNGNQLSRNWSERQGNFTDNGTTLVARAPGLSIATVNGVSFANASAQVDIVTGMASQNAGLVLRYQANGAYYLAQFVGNASQTVFTPYIYRYAPGVGFVQVASTTVAVPTSGVGTMRFEIAGSNLKLFWNGSLAAYAFDNAITAPGLAGLRVSSGLTFDNFVAD